MFLGRLLSFLVSAFFVVAGIALVGDDAVIPGVVLASVGGLTSALVIVSLFRKSEKGQLPDHLQDVAQLSHDDIAGFFPFISVHRQPEEKSVAMSVTNAIAAPEERVIVRSYARAGEVLCLVVVTNRQYLIYRVSSMGITGRIILGLIHKIPFGSIITWPVEGLIYAWLEVFQTERKGLERAMQVPDDVLISGKVKGWKTLRRHSLIDLHTELEAVSVKPSGWSGGFNVCLTPRKWRKVFSFTDLNLTYSEHMPLVKALVYFASPYFAQRYGWTLEPAGDAGLMLKPPEGVQSE